MTDGTKPDIQTEWRGDVAVIHWHDGENRFNRGSVDALNASYDAILDKAGDGPLAVVLSGEGKIWSNGLDLDWLMSAGDEGKGFLDDIHALFARMLTFPAIVVGALNGHTFAAGAMFSCAHDFLVMRDDRGYWCLPEADLGLPLTPAMLAVVNRKLPKLAANEAILTGKRYTAQEALAAGIVHRTAPEAEVLDVAVAMATELAGKSRSTVTRHKELLYGETAAVCLRPNDA